MAAKTKAKIKTCVHCGHTFDPNNRWHDPVQPGVDAGRIRLLFA